MRFSSSFCHPRESGDPEKRKIRWIPGQAGDDSAKSGKNCTSGLFVAFLAGLVLLSLPAYADGGYLYQEDGCEFQISFPGEPYISTRCEPGNAKKCDKVASYTKVFGIDSTVNVTVVCKPVTENTYNRYTGDIMQVSVSAMAEKAGLRDYETGFQQFENAKEAVAIGQGQEGASDKIFIGQLWVGKKSIFTVEAELIGQELKESDDMFAAILKSIHHESWKPGETPAAAPKDQGRAEDKGDKKEEDKKEQ